MERRAAVCGAWDHPNPHERASAAREVALGGIQRRYELMPEAWPDHPSSGDNWARAWNRTMASGTTQPGLRRAVRMRQPNSLVAGLVTGLTFAASAGAETTIKVVAPESGAEVPSNAVLWVHAESSEETPLRVVLVQDGSERIFRTAVPDCCFSYTAEMAPLSEGPLSVTLTPFDDSPGVDQEYVVAQEEDTEPPTIGPPRLTVMRGSFTIVIAEATELDDDWGVLAVVPEFNSDQQGAVLPGVPPPPPAWEVEHTLVGPEQIAEGAPGFYTNEEEEACARMTAVDMGGNRTTSETTCVSLTGPTPLEWLLEQGRALACSCATVGTAHYPFEVVPIVAVALLAARRRRR